MLTRRLRRLPNIVKSMAAAKVILPPTVLSMPNSNLILEKKEELASHHNYIVSTKTS